MFKKNGVSDAICVNIIVLLQIPEKWIWQRH